MRLFVGRHKLAGNLTSAGMTAVKNILLGLVVIAALAVGGFLIYVAGSMVLAILGMVVSVVVVVAPIALGVASVIFIVLVGAYAFGKAIREPGKG